MNAGVTVCVPTIPPRAVMLSYALNSICAQTVPVETTIIAHDHSHAGASATRTRAALASRTEWTLFLDDDDQLKPNCVERLLALAAEHGSEVTWGWFDCKGGTDPFPMHRGRQWDPDDFHVVPITYLARTSLLHAAIEKTGGFSADPDNTGAWHIQDIGVFRAMYELCGGRFHASPEILWDWHHHGYAGGNTSGLGTRWK